MRGGLHCQSCRQQHLLIMSCRNMLRQQAARVAACDQASAVTVQVCRVNPGEKGKYIKIILSLLQSTSSAVVYECAVTLVGLSQAPTAIRAAANCYCQLLVSQSDNNVKLIVLDRLQVQCPEAYMSTSMSSCHICCMSTLTLLSLSIGKANTGPALLVKGLHRVRCVHVSNHMHAFSILCLLHHMLICCSYACSCLVTATAIKTGPRVSLHQECVHQKLVSAVVLNLKFSSEVTCIANAKCMANQMPSPMSHNLCTVEKGPW